MEIRLSKGRFSRGLDSINEHFKNNEYLEVLVCKKRYGEFKPERIIEVNNIETLQHIQSNWGQHYYVGWFQCPKINENILW